MTPKLIGSHPWLVILCYPSDQAIPVWPSHQYFRQLMSGLGEGGLFDYWNEISGGRLSAAGPNVISSIVPYPGQSGWRHCNKCLSLAFWDGSRLPGKCAGGDRHNHEQSSLYALAHSTAVEIFKLIRRLTLIFIY